jgi:hypothetical protein
LLYRPAGVEAEVERLGQRNNAGKLNPRALSADVANDAIQHGMAGRDDLRALETPGPRKAPPLFRVVLQLLLHGKRPIKLFAANCLSLDPLRTGKRDRL